MERSIHADRLGKENMFLLDQHLAFTFIFVSSFYRSVEEIMIHPSFDHRPKSSDSFGQNKKEVSSASIESISQQRLDRVNAVYFAAGAKDI